MQSAQPLTKDDILTFLRTHQQEIHDRFGVTKVALFGSYARGEETTSSDVDILIEMSKKSFSKRFYLKEFLEEHFQRRVDVGSFDSVHPFVMRFIEKDLVYA